MNGFPAFVLLSLSYSLLGCHRIQSEPAVQIPEGRTTAASAVVYGLRHGGDSFVYVAGPQGTRRLTNAIHAWEDSPVLSRDGALVAYRSGVAEEAKGTIWVAHVDGSHAHPISPDHQDALFPAFAPDGQKVFYAISQEFGHASPIAAPRRHGFDIVSIPFDPDQPIAGATPSTITTSYYRDLQSLAASPDGQHLLLSTDAYPIGALLIEVDLSHPRRQPAMFQPHVPGQSDIGPSFGQASYVGAYGMDIVFTAASEPARGGNYDYNVYRMSGVTGGDVVQVTQHKGMIEDLFVSPVDIVGYTDASGYVPVKLPPSH